jgi:competence protein ComEA
VLRKYSVFLAGILTGLISSALLLILLSEPRGYPVKLLPPPTAAMLRVHVAGAVISPGLYTFPPGAIVQDAIDAAGGPQDEAAIDLVNLAVRLEDGQQIFVPRLAAGTGSSTQPSPPLAQSNQININSASAPELETLPGIGPSLAERIIEWRRENGLFTSLEALMDVPGIGPVKFEALLPLITLR